MKNLVWLFLPFLVVGWYIHWQIGEQISAALQLLVWMLTVASGIGLVISLIGWASILYWKVREAMVKAKQADVIVADAGQQVFLQKDGLLLPAHLQTGPQVTDMQLWALFHRLHSQQTVEQLPPVIEQAALPAPWPERVDLLTLLNNEQGDVNNLVLGVTFDERGQQRILRTGLDDMVHVGIGGVTGSGKSVFMTSLFYQLATATQNVQLAALDMEARTFGVFANCSKLRYPIGDEDNDMLAILKDLRDEFARRKELWRPYPEIENLAEYNLRTGDNLPPIVTFIDEFTSLMSRGGQYQALTQEIVQRARKYGIYIIAGSQGWKAKDFSTGIRDQFVTRLHFRAGDVHSSRALLNVNEPSAATITVPGRAYARLAGEEMGAIRELQAPIISKMRIVKQLQPQLPAPDRPTVVLPPKPEPPLWLFVQEWLELGKDYYEAGADVFAEYSDWADEYAETHPEYEPITDRNLFTPALRELFQERGLYFDNGQKRVDGRNCRVYKGIRLVSR